MIEVCMRAALLSLMLALATCTLIEAKDETVPRAPLPALSVLIGPAPAAGDPAVSISRVVARRCAVCHGCYDAPCQLKLTSPDGLVRGGSKLNVYDTERLSDATPTRLGIDATTEAAWRDLGFHSVTAPSVAGDPDSSPMARLLALGRTAYLVPDAPLPDGLDITRTGALNCPAPDGIAGYAAANPLGGMPYAMAPLPDEEFAALGRWVLSGAVLPATTVEPSPDVTRQIADWEVFLNTPDPRYRLVSRYLYEHLFLGHMHIEGDAPDRFYRLVRSSTPSGTPVLEIATRRPFNDPGPRLYYRLVPIAETIVHKDHIVYALSPARMARYRTLFLDPDWSVGELPPYGAAEGGNPFRTFAALPVDGRYRFLLDDALFFVRSFIRGPVCHGQIATDVIEDRFWVAFMAPEADLSVADPTFLADGLTVLDLPVSAAESTTFAQLWPVLHDRNSAWLAYRDRRYRESPAHADGPRIGAIWDGDGGNEEALLTVFRNYDNASVVTGFVGALPETAWVIDYPVFERIYYDLVAGYDVFSDVETQITTRLYMDHLRREAEDQFLSFLPRDTRIRLHDEWYRGPLAELHASSTEHGTLISRPTAVDYATADPMRELLLGLPARHPDLWATTDPLNRCDGADCAQLAPPARALAALTSTAEPWVRYMPDLSLLRVTRDDGSAEVFSMFHDKAHTNVGLMFDEESRREPERDVLTIMPAQVGSYPNFFFEVREADLAGFVADLRAVRSQQDWLAVVGTHGVRRSGGAFWRVADAMADDMLAQDAMRGGLLDLGRYVDPKPGDAIE